MMDSFMEIAIDQARLSAAEGGIPIGAVLVRKGRIVGRGHNRRIQDNDPVAHAEIVCLRSAGRIRNYDDTVLYSTLMPCYLCAGAIIQFGIKRVVVGESQTFGGARELLQLHGVEITDLNINGCRQLMENFIAANPEIWDEDIGRQPGASAPR